jgi:hypothetical protein
MNHKSEVDNQFYESAELDGASTNATNSPMKRILTTVAIVFIVIAILALFFSSRSHYPGMSDRLYKTPISSIGCIKIEPYEYLSLVNHEVVITDATTISNIMTAIRLAVPYSPNHPSTDWQCRLVVSDASGDSYVSALKTRIQGTIIYCESSSKGGWIYDTLQSDSLGDILKSATVGK